MCGIAGYLDFGASPGSRLDLESNLARVMDSMAQRGPDASGTCFPSGGRVGLGHRRLSIIDLSPTANQPMLSADGRSSILLNGEIYNYRALRAALEAQGRVFRTHSDTEVVLHLYETEGERFVEQLRGMFAIAIWDENQQKLVLARDPYGIKPLYIADAPGTVWFASQVKALARLEGVNLAPDPAGHTGFFLYGYVPEPYTLHRGIRALPAGSILTIDRAGKRTSRRYFDLAAMCLEAQETAAPENPHLLREALLDSVRHHLEADVPLAALLSSGIDSSVLLALAKEAGASGMTAITLGFREFINSAQDEAPLASQVAMIYDVPHSTSVTSEEDFRDSLPHLLQRMDQPSIDGVNTYFVCRAVKKAGVKVAISGVGGDELFGGYPSFDDVPRMAKRLGPMRALKGPSRAIRKAAHALMPSKVSPKYAGLLEYGSTFGGAYLLRRSLFMPYEMSAILGEQMTREGLQALDSVRALDESLEGIHSSFLKILVLESERYMRNQLLRDADWAGMAHSVEVRTPLVDVGLLRALLPQLARDRPPTKHDLAAVAHPPIPDVVRDRPKTGFGTPIQCWISDLVENSPGDRGLRPWARYVHKQFTS